VGMDYEHCYTCIPRFKHPKGTCYVGGHFADTLQYYFVMMFWASHRSRYLESMIILYAAAPNNQLCSCYIICSIVHTRFPMRLTMLYWQDMCWVINVFSNSLFIRYDYNLNNLRHISSLACKCSFSFVRTVFCFTCSMINDLIFTVVFFSPLIQSLIYLHRLQDLLSSGRTSTNQMQSCLMWISLVIKLTSLSVIVWLTSTLVVNSKLV
jgi:hypothetical protein